ncbi:UspA domain-containing protein [Acidithiobacillus ferrivorans SS3]|uniref:Universal stress protein n=1 Tax=Acidithiobacillus ferrivorans SS3 TaxID=743299 RepID=G0JPU3_9PROT|nr:universal stress protein [Acidithiobacillus ferrivorans]AEM47418.1 UspA domain-containing protein [Acidithiobacillus ferrivorans SS3]
MDKSPVKTPIKHILVAVDFSPMALYTTRMAAQEAQLHDARLTLLHIFNPQMLNLQMPEEILPPTLDLREKLLHLAHAEMEKLRQSVAAGGITPQVELEESGENIGKAVIAFGKAHAVDMLVVGSHGHGAIGRLLLGSVANDVVHYASCPVLVVKHQED